MNDIFENRQRLPICEHEPPKLATVNLSIFIKQPCAKFIQNRLIAWRTPGEDAMRKRICIDRVCTQMLQHAAHNTFAGSDITCQTNYIFSGPIAHRNSWALIDSRFILMSFRDFSNRKRLQRFLPNVQGTPYNLYLKPMCGVDAPFRCVYHDAAS